MTELSVADLPGITWSGSPLHIENIHETLEAVPREVDYLCVRAPTGEIVCKGGINYSWLPGTGMLYQLATREDLMGLGLATHLIRAAEEMVRARGLRKSSLRVEPENIRALTLYERLGYVAMRHVTSEWDQQAEDGTISKYVARMIEMEKTL